ncbi:hypothetical protein ASPWEDRAFT_40561 [Aspergillus wentii DTO 134E9]|uniref:F-box domain-containing protein n=1 Tax=Aspergillus wentii DTO 134E9 TaxID=1073089 RepID=A0A1L9RKB8_ASPWE|nr:uncharacterized protein ASPWEDRAFT_40561 [Aspergillus wentii DTO 134E9]KAI9924875.1 hypothetical protein MW887_006732 [Aspergillus wentii]OJJ35351.1 hypothetical protein ASPWEDRAFT_40561 [Aspergillus wentii DTO 134E9]
MDAPKTYTHQALSTPELLELILLQLDLRTLIASTPQVCRAWAALVKESSLIQEALFMKPLRKHPNSEKQLNPLLVDAFPPLFQYHDPETPEGEAYELPLTTLDMVKRPEKKEAYLRPEASWRRMLVQQPPATTLAVYQTSVSCQGYSGSYTFLQRKDPEKAQEGIRMDLLFDLVLLDGGIDFEYCFRDQVVWWPWIPRASHWGWQETLHDLGNVRLADIMLSGGCAVSHDDTESESESEEEQIVKQIRAAYRDMGLKKKNLEGWDSKENKQWGGMWD